MVRAVKAPRFLIDGSFVTSKPQPKDLDAVVLLPADFDEQVQREFEPALALYDLCTIQSSEDLFAAQDNSDWLNWIEFFSRTREADRRRKGVVEILL